MRVIIILKDGIVEDVRTDAYYELKGNVSVIDRDYKGRGKVMIKIFRDLEREARELDTVWE